MVASCHFAGVLGSNPDMDHLQPVAGAYVMEQPVQKQDYAFAGITATPA